MPKITVNEHGNLAAHEGNVRRARKFLHVLPKTKATLAKSSANKTLKISVRRANPGHAVLALRLREIVHAS
jgi:hypothetical protein